MAHTDEHGSPAAAQSKTARRMNGNGGTRSILLTRHGATKMNNDDVSVDRLRGWIDVPLSPEGKKEAQRLAVSVAKHGPEAIFTSDLCRAEETANIISKHTGIKVEKPTKDFRPWNIGDLAGEKAMSAVPVLAKYAEHTPDKPVPGGESFDTFRNRFLGGLRKALEKSDGLIAVVTHHRAERLLKAWIKDGCRPDGEIDKAEFSKKGEPTGHCEILNIPIKRLKEA